MKVVHSTSILMTTSVLVACGGGGGGGGDSADTANAAGGNSAQQTVTETPVVAEPVIQQGDVTTAELLVDRAYTLKQEFPLAIDVTPTDQAVSYLSICSEFDLDQPEYAINYDSCLIRTAVDGPASYTLQVPNAVETLVAVRWQYEAGTEPVYSFWDREQDGDAFSVR
jgi:hypothetical protein